MPISNSNETAHARHNEEQISKARRKQSEGQHAAQQNHQKNELGQSQQDSDNGDKKE